MSSLRSNYASYSDTMPLRSVNMFMHMYIICMYMYIHVWYMYDTSAAQAAACRLGRWVEEAVALTLSS